MCKSEEENEDFMNEMKMYVRSPKVFLEMRHSFLNLEGILKLPLFFVGN